MRRDLGAYLWDIDHAAGEWCDRRQSPLGIAALHG